jgi:hypothetical protein
MSTRTLVGVAGTTVALWAATTAAAVIWLTVTDPVGLATVLGTGDLWTLLTTFARHMLALLG